MGLSFVQRTVPLRMDERSFTSADDRDFNIESMTILYNLGIAHLRLAESMSESIKAAKIQNLACHFFKMVLSLNHDRSEIKAEKMKSIDEKRIMLSILALQNLARLQQRVGKRSEAIESCQKLFFFRSVVIEQNVCNEEIRFLS